MKTVDNYEVPGQMKMIRKNKDLWQLHTRKGAWKGSLRQVWQKMHFEFEIANSEIRYATQEMDTDKYEKEWNKRVEKLTLDQNFN